MNETELRNLLHGAAASGGAALLDDDSAVDHVVATHRTRRRQRLAATAAALCLAVLAVAVPVWLVDRQPSGSDTASPTSSAPAAAPVLDWQPRGSLVDEAWARNAVRRIAWDEPQWSPPVTARGVAFLDDVGEQRLALVVGRAEAGDAPVGQWLSGPAGTDPADLVADGAVERLDGRLAVSHLVDDGRTLLVLVAPGDEVEVSPRVLVDAGGSLRREFAPVDTDDGVAVTTIPSGSEHGAVTVYRVRRGGAVLAEETVGVPFGMSNVFDPPDLEPRYDLGEPPAPESIDLAIGQVAAATGLPEEALRLELLWSAPLPSTEPAGDPANVVALAVTLPDGAVVVSVAWSDIGPAGDGTAGTCGAQSHPAGTPVTDLVVAANCTFPSASAPGQDERLLVMFAPAGEAVVEVVAPDGTEVGRLRGGPAVAAGGAAPEGSVARATVDGRPLPEVAVVSTQGQIVDRQGRTAGG